MKDYKIVTYLLKYILFVHIVYQITHYNGMTSLMHPFIHQHPSGFHRKKRQPKFSRNCSLHQKSPVLTSSPIVQKKEKEAKHMKNNIKEMVQSELVYF